MFISLCVSQLRTQCDQSLVPAATPSLPWWTVPLKLWTKINLPFPNFFLSGIWSEQWEKRVITWLLTCVCVCVKLAKKFIQLDNCRHSSTYPKPTRVNELLYIYTIRLSKAWEHCFGFYTFMINYMCMYLSTTKRKKKIYDRVKTRIRFPWLCVLSLYSVFSHHPNMTLSNTTLTLSLVVSKFTW